MEEEFNVTENALGFGDQLQNLISRRHLQAVDLLCKRQFHGVFFSRSGGAILGTPSGKFTKVFSCPILLDDRLYAILQISSENGVGLWHDDTHLEEIIGSHLGIGWSGTHSQVGGQVKGGKSTDSFQLFI